MISLLLRSKAFYWVIILGTLIGGSYYMISDLKHENEELSKDKKTLELKLSQHKSVIKSQEMTITELEKQAKKLDSLLAAREHALRSARTKLNQAEDALLGFINEGKNEEVKVWADDAVPSGVYERLFAVPETRARDCGSDGCGKEVSTKGIDARLPSTRTTAGK